MSEDNISYLPVWKKDSTPEEFLQEVALIARKYPDRFTRIGIAFDETLPNGNTVTHYHCYNVSTTELIGLFECAKMRVYEFTSR